LEDHIFGLISKNLLVFLFLLFAQTIKGLLLYKVGSENRAYKIYQKYVTITLGYETLFVTGY